MTIIESKEKLSKEGFTYFNLKDFDETEYNKLLELKCNEDNNFQKYMTSFRGDALYNPSGESKNSICVNDDFETFEVANQKKDEILLNSKKLAQLWFFRGLSKVLEDSKSKYAINDYEKLIKKIVDFYFDMEESQEYSTPGSITYYNNDCILENHSDGTATGRICALLIYLNESYNEEDGGILILNNEEKILPVFGNVAIIDLQTFDIPHMVTKVTGGIGRYAILSFVKKKEDEFVNF